MKRIKVIELLPSLGSGGAERLALDIARRLDQARFDPLVVSLYPPESRSAIYRDFETDTGVRVRYLNKKPGFDPGIIRALDALFREEKPQVVHTHLYAGIYALYPETRRHIPGRVHTVHNLAEKELPPLHQKIMAYAYRRGKVTPVAISPLIRESIERRYPRLPGTVPVIVNGVDTARFVPPADRRPHRPFRFIFVARFSPQKNHTLLLDAFALAKKRNPALSLCLVGEGELRDALQRQAETRGVSASVAFAGSVKNVEEYLRRSDGFVMSSDYEGLPLSVIEAMATGLPVVSTRAGGVADLVEDGVEGFLSSPGDAQGLAQGMLRLAGDPEAWQAMSRAARERSRRFGVDAMVRKYERLFEQSARGR